MLLFLAEYGAFLAKILTVAVISLVFTIILANIFSGRQKNKENLLITHINDSLDRYQEILETELLPKPFMKIKQKLNRKAEKQKNKEAKQLAKKQNDAAELNKSTNPRIFVINFHGDIEAKEVESLRNCITAILTIATSKDSVLLRLESAGGMVHQYGLAAAQLERFKQHNISLTVAVDRVAASGGYMMACVAPKIIAAPFAILGSIGVIAQLPNLNRLLNKLNIDIEHHTAGQYKSTLTLLGKNDNKGREKFCEELTQTHSLFKNFIHKHRAVIDIENIATGEHWYASQAIGLNLVDKIQTSDEYILEHRHTHDIYEIKIEIAQSLRDKLSGVISSSLVKLYDTFINKAHVKQSTL